MKAPHNAYDAVLAGRVGNQTPTFLEPGNAAHQYQVSSPTLSQVVHAYACAENSTFSVDVDFLHRGFLRDILGGIEYVPTNRDPGIRDHDVHFAELVMRSFE